MKLIVDRDSGVLTQEDQACSREIPLYSREAFELLSREWVRVGWAVQHYFTFTWLGRPILQLPEDLVRLQEVVALLRPDTIVETGIYDGGSLLFHATLCEAIGKGRVVGIDKHIGPETRAGIERNPLSHRIDLIEGDSTSPATIEAARRLIHSNAGTAERSVMVILDSFHSKEHVGRELKLYAPLVTPGSCIVITDGIMRELSDVPGGNPAWAQDNPAAAALEFASAHPEFEMRQPRWPFNRSNLETNITYWPDGWLWRKQ
jgi:cephalosporin hydroxylase